MLHSSRKKESSIHRTLAGHRTNRKIVINYQRYNTRRPSSRAGIKGEHIPRVQNIICHFRERESARRYITEKPQTSAAPPTRRIKYTHTRAAKVRPRDIFEKYLYIYSDGYDPARPVHYSYYQTHPPRGPFVIERVLVRARDRDPLLFGLP